MRLQQPLRFALGIARLVLFALRVQPCQQLARRHRQRCDIRQRVDARGQAGHQRRSTTILAQLRQMRAGQFQLPQCHPARTTLQRQLQAQRCHFDQQAMRSDPGKVLDDRVEARAQIPVLRAGSRWQSAAAVLAHRRQ